MPFNSHTHTQCGSDEKKNEPIYSFVNLVEWATHIHKIMGFPLIYGVCVRWRAPFLSVLCSAPMVKFTWWWWLCVSHLPISLLDRFIWSIEQFCLILVVIFFFYWNSQDSSKLDYMAKKIVHFVIRLMTVRWCKMHSFLLGHRINKKYYKNFYQELWEIYDIRFPLTVFNFIRKKKINYFIICSKVILRAIISIHLNSFFSNQPEMHQH